MDINLPCLICTLKPDLRCFECKKAYCGDCWKYKKTCHNAPHTAIGGWNYDRHKPYSSDIPDVPIR